MDLTLTLFLTFGCPLLLLVLERFQAEPGRPWVTPNLLTDGCVGALRFLLITGLLGGFIVGAQEIVQRQFSFAHLGVLDVQPAWIVFATYFVAMDFFYYAFHRIMHSTKTLWVFHAVHHAQRRPNPMMQNRSHIVEEVAYVVSRAIPPVILGGSAPVIFWFIVVDQFWSYFVHADIKVNLGPLKYLVVTPQYHRIHHSLERRHFDKNFGGRLILWDYLFGTMNPRFDEYPEIGIEGYPVVEESRSPLKILGYAWGNLIYPFTSLWKHFITGEAAKNPDPATAHEPLPSRRAQLQPESVSS